MPATRTAMAATAAALATGAGANTAAAVSGAGAMASSAKPGRPAAARLARHCWWGLGCLRRGFGDHGALRCTDPDGMDAVPTRLPGSPHMSLGRGGVPAKRPSSWRQARAGASSTGVRPLHAAVRDSAGGPGQR